MHYAQYSGKERQLDFGLGWADYGARFYDMQGAPRWLAVDPAAEAYASWSPYTFVRNNPTTRLDPNGRWDITVRAYNNRKQHGYGIAVVTDRTGKEVYRFDVRLQGVGGSDRMKKNADTPLGTYDIPDKGMWKSGGPRKSYGPNPRLILIPESGEIKNSGRDDIRIHGGRQETQSSQTGEFEPNANAELKKTQGCMRCKDESIKTLKEVTEGLQKNDSEEKGGKITVVADLQREEVKGPLPDKYTVPKSEQPSPFYSPSKDLNPTLR